MPHQLLATRKDKNWQPKENGQAPKLEGLKQYIRMAGDTYQDVEQYLFGRGCPCRENELSMAITGRRRLSQAGEHLLMEYAGMDSPEELIKSAYNVEDEERITEATKRAQA